jgi:hypothetical protein
LNCSFYWPPTSLLSSSSTSHTPCSATWKR